MCIRIGRGGKALALFHIHKKPTWRLDLCQRFISVLTPQTETLPDIDIIHREEKQLQEKVKAWWEQTETDKWTVYWSSCLVVSVQSHPEPFPALAFLWMAAVPVRGMIQLLWLNRLRVIYSHTAAGNDATVTAECWQVTRLLFAASWAAGGIFNTRAFRLPLPPSQRIPPAWLQSSWSCEAIHCGYSAALTPSYWNNSELLLSSTQYV